MSKNYSDVHLSGIDIVPDFIAEAISIVADWSGRVDFAFGRQLGVFAVKQFERAERSVKLE